MNPGVSRKVRCRPSLVRSLVAALLVSGCAPYQALTREYYRAPANDPSRPPATIVGSGNEAAGTELAVKVYIGGFDELPVGLAKTARCNIDKPYPVAPGSHSVAVAYTVGPEFTQSRLSGAVVSLVFEAGGRYVAKGEYLDGKAYIWVENRDKGSVVVERKEYPLHENPAKGMPIGFAAMTNSCAVP